MRDMRFYLHQLWLLASCVLLAIGVFSPIGEFSNADGATACLTNFRIIYVEGVQSGAFWALGVLLIITLLAAVFELLLSGFKNFQLQRRLILLSLVLLLFYYLATVIYILILKGDAQFRPEWGFCFPLVSMVLLLLGMHGVNRAEADIIAQSNVFRLRD